MTPDQSLEMLATIQRMNPNRTDVGLKVIDGAVIVEYVFDPPRMPIFIPGCTCPMCGVSVVPRASLSGGDPT